jgi:hypothetical protein
LRENGGLHCPWLKDGTIRLISAFLIENKFFGCRAGISILEPNTYGASVPPSSGNGGGGGAARGLLRLQVLNSLPPAHQRYLFEKVRVLCTEFLRNRRVPTSELTSQELLSEIYQKLLGTVSVDDRDFPPVNATEWSIDADAPDRDGRVVWLIEEIGGAQAIAHRHEDIRRQRFGRSGQLTQREPKDEINEHGSYLPDQAVRLERIDAYHALRGLLATADQQFPLHDDVSALLRLMNKFGDILEESSSGQWPIARMVALLNQHFPPPTWTDHRVDNAKRRLTNWINRLMRRNGLDVTDLVALFARVARKKERNATQMGLH